MIPGAVVLSCDLRWYFLECSSEGALGANLAAE